ncbi:MAG: carbohydrate porin [Proteobacteria bacterium]|nr:carbohydrate porin [Pseudomonadota bacterium]
MTHPRLALVAMLAALACTSLAAAPAANDVETRLNALAARLAELEAQNQALRSEVQALRGTATAQPGSWGTPLTERVQAVEARVNQMQAPRPPVSVAGAAGPTVEGSVLGMAQHVGSGGGADGASQSRANWRGDLTVALPLGWVRSLGNARFDAFGHLRAGQGGGVALRPTYSATPNSIPFEAGAGSSETYAIVAQAWGQMTWPLDAKRFNDLPGSRVELTAGKMDVFGFFDQNAVAGDEGAQFLNNVFVHNPMLDSGGDIAADAYGLAPGARLSYLHEGDDTGWALSLGAFASGAGADFNLGLGGPLVLAQAEWVQRQINGEPRGTWRLYGWTNGRTTDLAGDPQRHSGWGISIDHKLGAAWNLFGRWGQRTQGDGAFDRALTLGFEHGGRTWGRPRDGVGLAGGWLHGDAGTEQTLELYYRFYLNEYLTLTPDVQWVRRAAGEASAGSFGVFGLRAAVGF